MVVNMWIGQHLKGDKTMRKIFFLMLLTFLLVGCSTVSNGNDLKGNDVMEDIYFTETERCEIDWNKVQLSIDFKEDVLKKIKPIGTKQIAVAVGKSIIEELHGDGKVPEYNLTSITHSTEDNIWCFEYSTDKPNADINNLIDGGCLYVAINGNNGTLIQAWLEE